jgi:hypothetical protein
MLRPISPNKTSIGTPITTKTTSYLSDYQEALLGGMKKEGGKKTTNMSKTSEVLQGPDESPSQFYECLCEAFHLYTPFDPEATENQWMINAAFFGRARETESKIAEIGGIFWNEC